MSYHLKYSSTISYLDIQKISRPAYLGSQKCFLAIDLFHFLQGKVPRCSASWEIFSILLSIVHLIDYILDLGATAGNCRLFVFFLMFSDGMERALGRKQPPGLEKNLNSDLLSQLHLVEWEENVSTRLSIFL